MRLVLEDRIRPPLTDDPWSRDVMSVALLLVMAAVLLPAWNLGRQSPQHEIVGQMLSFLLLPSLGFLLALRRGAIDLSVWVNAGVGGVVAAGLIVRGCPVGWAFALAAVAGAALGAVNGVLVGFARLPSLVVTLATAALTLWAVGSVVPGREVAIGEMAFESYLGWHDTPVLAVRILTVAGAYLAVLATLVVVDAVAWFGAKFPRRLSLLASLCVSGALSAAGGAFWLLDNNQAPVPTRIVDDLRVPAAALLAGAVFLGRRGRELLAALSLPAALLLTTIWRQKVWFLPAPGYGYALQVLLLAGMTVGVHLALGWYVDTRDTTQKWPLPSAMLSVAGLALVGTAANWNQPLAQDLFHAAGLAFWLGGVGILAYSIRRPAPARLPRVPVPPP